MPKPSQRTFSRGDNLITVCHCGYRATGNKREVSSRMRLHMKSRHAESFVLPEPVKVAAHTDRASQSMWYGAKPLVSSADPDAVLQYIADHSMQLRQAPWIGRDTK